MKFVKLQIDGAVMVIFELISHLIANLRTKYDDTTGINWCYTPTWQCQNTIGIWRFRKEDRKKNRQPMTKHWHLRIWKYGSVICSIPTEISIGIFTLSTSVCCTVVPAGSAMFTCDVISLSNRALLQLLLLWPVAKPLGVLCTVCYRVSNVKMR